MAQVTQTEIDLKDILESVAENLPEDYDMVELVEILNRYKKHPLNLNYATVDDLKPIIFLSPVQIGNLLDHIKKNGLLLDLAELQTIDLFDVKTIQNLLPFVTLSGRKESNPITFGKLIRSSENDLIIQYAQTLEQKAGFKDLEGSRYLGTPEKLLIRYRYHLDDKISAALTMEKDPGEAAMYKSVDFLSGHIKINNVWKIKELVIGDYALQFGEGLTLWSGFGFGKSPDIIGVAKKDLGLRGYSSSNEYSFFRGLAATIQLSDQLDFTPFISYRSLDASQSITADGNIVQATITQTGLHRTATEIENKNSLKQNVIGFAAKYKLNAINITGMLYRSNFSNNFITQTAIYDRYSFTGSQLTNMGISYNYTIKNAYIFGELAHSLGSGLASINGVIISLSPVISTSISYRNYQKNYYSFFNQAFAESSQATNERGFYAGLNLTPNKFWSFSAYIDQFSFPWLKYLVDAPSGGYEILAQLVYSPRKNFRIQGRFKTEIKPQNTDVDMAVKYLDDVKKEGYRLDLNWAINPVLSFENRLEVSQYKKGNPAPEFGYLLYQDISLKPQQSKLSGNLRLAYFNTPSYNSRIYAYEDDVLYSFAFGVYNGKGARTYINLKYNAWKKINLWFRYAMFIYSGVETVGTYLDEIQGNKKSELKIQLRYQF